MKQKTQEIQMNEYDLILQGMLMERQFIFQFIYIYNDETVLIKRKNKTQRSTTFVFTHIVSHEKYP